MVKVWVLTEYDADDGDVELVGVFFEMRIGVEVMRARYESSYHAYVSPAEFNLILTHRGADGMEAWSVMDEAGETEWLLQEKTVQ